jgi:hypothetical protein
MTDTLYCTCCRTPLDDGNTPSPFSVQAVRARRRGFDRPLRVNCLLRLDEAELPDAVRWPGTSWPRCATTSPAATRGVPRQTLEEARRLLTDRLKRDPQTALTEVDALDEGD